LRAIYVSDEVVTAIVSVATETRASLEDKGKDFRIALGRIVEIQSVCKGMIDLSRDGETRFAFMLFYDFLGMTGLCEGKTNSWYSLNADTIAAIREKLSRYLERMMEALKKKDYDAVVESTKDWYNEAHILVRKLTTDVKATKD
jgi:hypothetical protein